jgi:electron transport complex protein RnfB
MEQSYERLALILDRMPNGFPGTESGVELRILAKLFSPEEAELACRLEAIPRSSAEISSSIGRDEGELRLLLKSMLGKGLIEVAKTPKGIGFKLIPFVVGFYERQNGRIDEEFAALFEAYQKEAFHRIMSIKPSVHRVIPVERSIPIGVEVMPYERASHYVRNARAWAVIPCICRVQKRLVGRGCGHTEENCLALSHRPGIFDGRGGFKPLSMEEALKVLSDADEEGLVHSTGNVREGVSYICNCCTCSCGVLNGFVEWGYPYSIGKSDFYTEVDSSLCSGCEACVDRCPFNALAMRDGVCAVDASFCYGCGLCVSSCPTKALGLKLKPAAEIEVPPATEEEWAIERAAARVAAPIGRSGANR